MKETLGVILSPDASQVDISAAIRKEFMAYCEEVGIPYRTGDARTVAAFQRIFEDGYRTGLVAGIAINSMALQDAWEGRKEQRGGTSQEAASDELSESPSAQPATASAGG